MNAILHMKVNKSFAAKNVSTADDYVKVYTPTMTYSEGWDFHWPFFEPINLTYEQGSVLVLPQRLTNPLFGREELNQRLQEMATGAPYIEQIWEITKKLPSLSKLLSEERDNE